MNPDESRSCKKTFWTSGPRKKELNENREYLDVWTPKKDFTLDVEDIYRKKSASLQFKTW